jgi:beta-glucosidase/6-phospho-beta-glucosidase/beta-galactosidase
VNGPAVSWLEDQWSQILALRADGIPVHGFTWYSLTDQIDWQHGLRIERDDLHPVGLYDLDRRIRPVGIAYRKIVAEYRDVMGSDVPLAPAIVNRAKLA